MKKSLLLFALLFAVPALAQTVTLQWDPHEQAADLQGFRLYCSKQSMVYGAAPCATFSPGSATQGSVTVSGPGRWYFVLTAFMPDPMTQADLESDFSNEASTVIKPKPPRLVSAVQTALAAPVKGAKKLFEWAGIIERKNLRVVGVR